MASRTDVTQTGGLTEWLSQRRKGKEMQEKTFGPFLLGASVSP